MITRLTKAGALTSACEADADPTSARFSERHRPVRGSACGTKPGEPFRPDTSPLAVRSRSWPRASTPSRLPGGRQLVPQPDCLPGRIPVPRRERQRRSRLRHARLGQLRSATPSSARRRRGWRIGPGPVVVNDPAEPRVDPAPSAIAHPVGARPHHDLIDELIGNLLGAVACPRTTDGARPSQVPAWRAAGRRSGPTGPGARTVRSHDSRVRRSHIFTPRRWR